MNLSDANDDATTTSKQTGVHTLPHFPTDAVNRARDEFSCSRTGRDRLFVAMRASGRRSTHLSSADLIVAPNA